MALTKVQTNAIADDAVTTDKLANAINTERTANTAKVSLEDNAVTLAKMAGGTDGQIITYDANGDPIAVGPGTDGQVLTSTGAGSPPAFESPAAGVGGANGVSFNDDVYIQIGTGNDLKLFHNGTNSKIENATGGLYIDGATNGSIYLRPDNGQSGIDVIQEGAINLYYNNAKKLETSADGITMSGWVYIPDSDGTDNMLRFGNGADLKIYHDATNSWIDNGTGNLLIRDNTGDIYLQAPVVSLQGGTSESNKQTAKFTAGGAVELYHNDVKTLSTETNGVTILGTENGAAALHLYCDEGDDNADKWKWESLTEGTCRLYNYAGGSWETSIKAHGNGGIDLYHNNALKFSTTTAGNTAYGDITIYTGGSSQLVFYDVDTATIRLYTSSTALRWYADVDDDAIAELQQDGDMIIDGSYSTAGVDYAEYFESTDGSAIPVGTTVLLDNGKIRAATGSETPIGVIRPKTSGTSVTGGDHSLNWKGKYLADDYDGHILENGIHCTWKEGDENKQCWKDRVPTGVTIPDDAVEKTVERRKLNPSFDASKSYVPRSERVEWNCVGLLGQIPITKGQPTASNWIKMEERSSTVELWFVK